MSSHNKNKSTASGQQLGPIHLGEKIMILVMFPKKNRKACSLQSPQGNFYFLINLSSY
jgi:hypothetical protein